MAAPPTLTSAPQLKTDSHSAANTGKSRHPGMRAARPRRAATSNLRMAIPLIVLWVGCMFSLASSVVVYNDCRIALHAKDYRPAVFVVSSVTYGRGRHSFTRGEGTVNGRPETIGFNRCGLHISSQAQLSRIYPAGSRMEIWYDPAAADVMTQGEHLRVLPRSVELDAAFPSAIRTTLTWNSLTLVGMALMAVQRHRARRTGAMGKPPVRHAK